MLSTDTAQLFNGWPSEVAEALWEVFKSTVIQNPWIQTAPTDRQAEFLCDFGREAMYGGSAGGGKSEAMLMAAGQFVEMPSYSALLLRRTYADLSLPGALMDRSHDWWGGRAKWNGQEHKWTFPSGATITFGYLETERDKYRYQGAEFQFVGFDELTQFTESQYRYLFSRLRRTTDSNVPLRMRGATNPGGVGHEWVKKRFPVKGPNGSDRKFYPAKLDDNPHLDRTEYMQSLQELDPVTRAQLLAGSWDDYEGGRFKREWLRYYTRDHGRRYIFGRPDRAYAPEELRLRFLTVDPAATVKQTAKEDPDYTVVSAWALTPCGLLVWLGCLRIRVEVPDIPPRIAEMYALHRAGKVVIEVGGTQKSVAQITRRHRMASGQFLNVTEFVPSTDKLDRATDILNAAEAGRLWLPADDPSFPLEDVVAELLRFTGDPKQDGHDDIVDTASIAGKELVAKTPQLVVTGKPKVLQAGVVRL